MARRAVSVKLLPHWPGAVVAGLVALIFAACLLAVMLRAEGGFTFGPADWAAIRFTLWQAVLSAVLSVLLAIPVARALARRDFPGRRMLVTLLGAPFLLPVIVAVMGLLALFGRGGAVNVLLGALGFPTINIYGLHGVVLAHVFFNLPLATRLLLQGWQDTPAEHFRLAAQLGADKAALVRLLELPMLRRTVPGALALIFVLCLTSFAVVLLLGGGPKATTIELAIYQAFRFDFDLGRAALLALVQMGLALTACLTLLRLLPQTTPGTGLDAPPQRWDRSVLDLPVIALAAAFLLAPMVAMLGSGLGGLAEMPPQVWRAAGLSLLVAGLSTALLITMALPLAVLAAARGGVEAVGIIGLATSPLMLGTGAFILIFPLANPVALALPITAFVNALMALPFILRILVPGLRAALQDYGRLCQTLRLRGWSLWRHVLIPRLRRPLGFALGLSAALSMGDLGVIALFADADQATLPLQIERLMGAYRTEAAAGASLLLAAMSFGIFWLFDAWGRRDA